MAKVMVHNPTQEKQSVKMHGGGHVWQPGESRSYSEKRAKLAMKLNTNLVIGGAGETYTDDEIASMAKMKKPQLVKFAALLMSGACPAVKDFLDDEPPAGDPEDDEDNTTLGTDDSNSAE